MRLRATDEERALQAEVRDFMARERLDPAALPHALGERMEILRGWQAACYEAGYVGRAWPSEFGGGGRPPVEQIVVDQELAAAGAPEFVNVVGLDVLGPSLLRFGTDEQRRRHIPSILSAEEIWCQGFSEPEAGSDLASLKTRAVKDGDDWVVTGQKVWTSGAQYSKWCMLVARTESGLAKKHQGLTYFLMDMEQEGVQIRPLRQITGEAEFNELFIEEARIPDANVVGGEGNGWKVALTTLMNERAGLGFALQVRLRQLLDDLFAEAGTRGLLEDPLYADALAELHVRTETIRLLAWKGLTDVEKYGQPGPEGSLVKWLWSDTNQRLTQLAADIVGPEALTAGTHWSYELLRARGNSIEGGTTEVLKNIVAERVLGLPRLKAVG
jgi:alkylation response protein AidB-like acyl-CoA dehydrogenase